MNGGSGKGGFLMISNEHGGILKAISKTLKPNYILLSGRMYAPYKDFIWARMLKDPDYAKTFGYELTNVISFRNIPYALILKISEPDSAL